MGSDEFDEDHVSQVVHGDDQPVLIAADVEDDAIAAGEVGRSVSILDVLWRVPRCMVDLCEPNAERMPPLHQGPAPAPSMLHPDLLGEESSDVVGAGLGVASP